VKQVVWLKPNRRVLLVSMILPALLAMAGAWAMLHDGAWRIAGGVMLVVGLGLILLLAVQCARPRLALRGGQLRFWLKSGGPWEVPVDVVECFFISRASAKPAEGETNVVSVVARLAESAVDFKQRAVKPALGKWEEGYVTIRGTWCERLSLDVVNRLNQRLREAHRNAQAPH
jgi:hypothetical protein